MYQKFEDTSESAKSKQRISQLRIALQKHNLHGYIVPHADDFQGEYLPAYAERLAWLTGFTGSAGSAIILKQKAAIFVDGRYTIQVGEQTDADIISPLNSGTTSPSEWIAGNLPKGEKLGFDPWLLTPKQVAQLAKAAKKAGGQLVPLDLNLIDEIWHDQPEKPSKPIFSQSIEFAGKSTADKLNQFQSVLKTHNADAGIITMSDSVSWLFNIRGNEITHNPVVLAYAIIPAKGKAMLFIAADKVPKDVATLLNDTTLLKDPANLVEHLAQFGKTSARVLLDTTTVPYKISNTLSEQGATIIKATDPCTLPKAIKNETELEGARAAHQRDGAVMAQFLCWLEQTAPKTELDEIKAARKLEELRQATSVLKEISFDTISAAGPHAAIPHYRVTTASCLPLKSGEIYLCDSGGQYVDGTTDITRTVIIGKASQKMKDRNTLVLKGMIALSRARFPKGTNGAQLDSFARQYLWQSGLDFDHGTGHGVGSYLCVHEGPARISKAGTIALEPGMILSNEPGYYLQDEFGIRIENLVAVTEPTSLEGGEHDMMGFETLTLAPFDKNLINDKMLSHCEKDWLNNYHRRVFTEISPLLDEATAGWLKTATEKI